MLINYVNEVSVAATRKFTSGRPRGWCTILKQILAVRKKKKETASVPADKNLGQPDHFSRRFLWSYLTYPPPRFVANRHQQFLQLFPPPPLLVRVFTPGQFDVKRQLKLFSSSPFFFPLDLYASRKTRTRLWRQPRLDSFGFTIITHTVTRFVSAQRMRFSTIQSRCLLEFVDLIEFLWMLLAEGWQDYDVVREFFYGF